MKPFTITIEIPQGGRDECETDHEIGPDAEILTVLADDPRWERVHEPEDVPWNELDEITHFFAHDGDPESGKHRIVDGWRGRAGAERIIGETRRRGEP